LGEGRGWKFLKLSKPEEAGCERVSISNKFSAEEWIGLIMTGRDNKKKKDRVGRRRHRVRGWVGTTLLPRHRKLSLIFMPLPIGLLLNLPGWD
jgi:hypothetical protein